MNRGLTEQDVELLEYKTTPVVGMSAIAKQLQSDGLHLAGVPGFYRDKSGAWTFIHEKRGILIPVRDRIGRIQGLQIRRDNVSRRKFPLGIQYGNGGWMQGGRLDAPCGSGTVQRCC